MMNHMEAIAARKANKGEGWEPFAWERVGSDLLVKGGFSRLLKSGPNKGNKTWRDSPVTTVVVTQEEIKAEEFRYETETGQCARCYGKGEVFASWNIKEGTKLRRCKPCSGTGQATPTTSSAE